MTGPAPQAAAQSRQNEPAQPKQESTPKRPQVAVYYFPGYHPGDPRNNRIHNETWSEWELVKNARPLYAGEDQPRVPLWGYLDESDPSVMARKIDAAADNGVDAFIFNWYYYDDGPFLNRCLDQGYLGAANRQRVKFALMWANHDWIDYPYRLKENPNSIYPFSIYEWSSKPAIPGRVTPETFDKVCDHVIKDYFSQPSYWKIDGKPYFSICSLPKLVDSFGRSVRPTRAALDRFRDKVKQAGFPGLHLNTVFPNGHIERALLSGIPHHKDHPELAQNLGFDSYTPYQWVSGKLDTDYNEPRDWAKGGFDSWVSNDADKLPYLPNVTVGWDPGPRWDQHEEMKKERIAGDWRLPYRFGTLSGNTPERFREWLELTRDRLLAQKKSGLRVLTIHAWNDWTEGSYLEPDTVYGMKYLEAIKAVFPPSTKEK